MSTLEDIFDRNRRWASAAEEETPGFFATLSQRQRPDYLWIGCSDSRVPPNEITGLHSGELFVHRNIANLVVPTDLNCMAALKYAVDVLHVRHILVCGHYDCGGVAAALEQESHGLVDKWLGHVHDVRMRHQRVLHAIDDPVLRKDRLCELNLVEQVANVCATETVQGAWRRGQVLAVHGWMYSLHDGLLRDLGPCVTAPEQVDAAYRLAIASLAES